MAMQNYKELFEMKNTIRNGLKELVEKKEINSCWLESFLKETSVLPFLSYLIAVDKQFGATLAKRLSSGEMVYFIEKERGSEDENTPFTVEYLTVFSKNNEDEFYQVIFDSIEGKNISFSPLGKTKFNDAFERISSLPRIGERELSSSGCGELISTNEYDSNLEDDVLEDRIYERSYNEGINQVMINLCDEVGLEFAEDALKFKKFVPYYRDMNQLFSAIDKINNSDVKKGMISMMYNGYIDVFNDYSGCKMVRSSLNEFLMNFEPSHKDDILYFKAVSGDLMAFRTSTTPEAFERFSNAVMNYIDNNHSVNENQKASKKRANKK